MPSQVSFLHRVPAGVLLWGMVFAGWTFVVLASAGQEYMHDEMRTGAARPFLKTLWWPAIFWYGWALLTPLVFAVARRFPLAPPHRGRSLLVLVLACLGIASLHIVLQLLAMLLPYYRGMHHSLEDGVSFHVVSSIRVNILTFWALVGVWHAVHYYHRFRQREVQAAQLASELAKAQLHALRMQLHPHFLFNTLHAITTLMYRDVRAADRMLTRLSELLRLSIDNADRQEIPLREEVDFVEKYLQIEQARFEERLTVVLDIEQDVEDAMVPSFVLQPFVENAIKHGVAPQTAGGRVFVRAWAQGGQLRLRVGDDGPGLEAPPTARHGVGLANTRARLDALYGDAYRLSLDNDPAGGLVVNLALPLRRAEDHVAYQPERLA